MTNDTGFVLWLTGLSGAGKSTVAAKLEPALAERGHRLRLGQLALVEHVELLVDPLAGVEGVGGDGPGQHRDGRLVDRGPAQAPGGRDPGAQQGEATIRTSWRLSTAR